MGYLIAGVAAFIVIGHIGVIATVFIAVAGFMLLHSLTWRSRERNN